MMRLKLGRGRSCEVVTDVVEYSRAITVVRTRSGRVVHVLADSLVVHP